MTNTTKIDKLPELKINDIGPNEDQLDAFILETNALLKPLKLRLKTIYVGRTEQDILNKIFYPLDMIQNYPLANREFNLTGFVCSDRYEVCIKGVNEESHIGYGVEGIEG